MHVFIWVLVLFLIKIVNVLPVQFGELTESVPDIIDEDDCTYINK